MIVYEVTLRLSARQRDFFGVYSDRLEAALAIGRAKAVFYEGQETLPWEGQSLRREARAGEVVDSRVTETAIITRGRP